MYNFYDIYDVRPRPRSKKKILIGKADRKKLVSGLRFDQNFQILPKKMRQDKNFLIFSGGQIGMIPNPFCGWMESHFGPWVILSLYWVYGCISILLYFIAPSGVLRIPLFVGKFGQLLGILSN